jgi:serine acetyltransferase
VGVLCLSVCKGVTIGKNSVVGAGSVVASDIPENVIAAGNPAKVIKTLDPEKELTTRAKIFKKPAALERETESINRYVLKNNIFLN